MTLSKTGLSCRVLHHLQQERTTLKTPVICIYFDYNNAHLHTRANLFGSLLKQLLQLANGGPVVAALPEAYRKGEKILARPKADELQNILREQIETYDRVYVIVDALDECASDVRRQVDHDLQNLNPEKVRLMITSRQKLDNRVPANDVICDRCRCRSPQTYYRCTICHDPDFDICEDCKEKNLGCNDASHTVDGPYGRVEIEVKTPDEDIKGYVDSVIERETQEVGSQRRDERVFPESLGGTEFSKRCQDEPELRTRIPNVIIAKANGIFLFAKLYMDMLVVLDTVQQIDEALDSFPDKLDKFYEQNMERVKVQKEYRRGSTALKVLLYVVCAQRRLGWPELQRALAVRPGQHDHNEKEKYDLEDILSNTCGLIRVDGGENGAVRLAHRTLHQYLLDTHNKWFPENTEAEMANVCLAYLNYNEFANPCCDDEAFETRRKKYPFVAYASQYWGDHVREAGSDPKTLASAESLISDPRRVAAVTQAAWSTDRSAASWDACKDIDPLHLCAWFGLSSLIPSREQPTLEVDVRETTYGQTPLMYACRNGHAKVVKQLLGLGASVNIVSDRGQTALFEAILEDRGEVVELLIQDKLLDINAVHRNDHHRTALMLAAQSGYSSIVQRLLQHPEINVNAQDSNGYTALSIAAYNRSITIVKTLLSVPGIDANLVESSAGQSALMFAVEEETGAMVELLLRGGADPMLKDKPNGGIALMRAVGGGYSRAIEILIKHDQADLKFVDHNGRSLVHNASVNGHPKIVQLLEKRAVDINARDNNGLTPLHDASRSGNVQVTKVLLELNVDPNIMDNSGRTPYVVAWQHGETQIMEVLKDSRKIQPEDIEMARTEKTLPLWSVVKQGHTGLIAEILASKSQDPFAPDLGTGYTALHWAVKADRIDILKKLLDLTKGNLSLDSADYCKRTPLHHAVIQDNLPAVKLLVRYHATLDLLDAWADTALDIWQPNQNYSTAIALIEAGAAINKDKIDVQSMFFDAVELGSLKAIQALINKGADVLAKNDEGMTAMQIAKADGAVSGNHRDTIMQFLRSESSLHFGPPVRHEEGNTQLERADSGVDLACDCQGYRQCNSATCDNGAETIEDERRW